jgi:hypothetical protein
MGEIRNTSKAAVNKLFVNQKLNWTPACRVVKYTVIHKLEWRVICGNISFQYWMSRYTTFPLTQEIIPKVLRDAERRENILLKYRSYYRIFTGNYGGFPQPR